MAVPVSLIQRALVNATQPSKARVQALAAQRQPACLETFEHQCQLAVAKDK